ncbi:hypothetical protein C8R44DRAFT_747957 [Mycena epipterygia]|nr:hypothetical protein C8R44DRAFT_747957 [Mycena epipterygia]
MAIKGGLKPRTTANARSTSRRSTYLGEGCWAGGDWVSKAEIASEKKDVSIRGTPQRASTSQMSRRTVAFEQEPINALAVIKTHQVRWGSGGMKGDDPQRDAEERCERCGRGTPHRTLRHNMLPCARATLVAVAQYHKKKIPARQTPVAKDIELHSTYNPNAIALQRDLVVITAPIHRGRQACSESSSLSAARLENRAIRTRKREERKTNMLCFTKRSNPSQNWATSRANERVHVSSPLSRMKAEEDGSTAARSRRLESNCKPERKTKTPKMKPDAPPTVAQARDHA